MKILNYLNTSEFIDVSKKNDLPLNIIFFCLLILPFSFYIGPAVMEVLIFLTSVSYMYILIIKKEKIFLNKFLLVGVPAFKTYDLNCEDFFIKFFPLLSVTNKTL